MGGDANTMGDTTTAKKKRKKNKKKAKNKQDGSNANTKDPQKGNENFI
jgi:hypothetical protein